MPKAFEIRTLSSIPYKLIKISEFCNSWKTFTRTFTSDSSLISLAQNT